MIVKQKGIDKVKRGLAQMLKAGVIMDVTTPEQAIIAQEAGAVAVMALERVPADIRKEGGVARMAAIEVVQRIMDAVTIPVMAKARIGHFVEAQVLEALGIDFIDEIRRLSVLPEEEFVSVARDLGAPVEIVREVAQAGRLPVVMFVAGGIATPADAALCMRLGSEGVFVGSGIC